MKQWATEPVHSPSVKALIAAAVGAFLLLALAFFPRSEVLSLSGTAMGTQWQVQVVSDGRLDLVGLASGIDALLAELDRATFSTWSPDSELSRLNAVTDEQPVPVSPDLLQVLQAALRIHVDSDGAFDPTVGPLVDLWGFGPVEVTVSPGQTAIAAARARLGAAEVLVDTAAGTVSKPARVRFDLSGIAKGHAVDRVAALLLEQGVTSFLVEVGGELRVQGQRPGGEPWTIAIEQPDPDVRVVQALLDTRGEALALAGSGDYRNYRLVDGVRQSHEIDPLRGVPVQHGLAAVTVLADTAMLADAWATALMVLGPADALRVADRLGLSAYLIIRAGASWEVRSTGRFAEYLVDQEESSS